MSNTSSRIMFPTPGQARLETFPVPSLAKPTDVLIETEYSIVSAGTELACRAGIEGWAPLPFCPGYGSVGRVIAHGDAVKDITVGQRVLTFGKHAKHA
ncbi:MAG TPA: alcohol dehydrogenase catalytic domain-containing protein, partial [Rariglobus sp.]|nr:alcohol dehydrogenase catalytic domain-containing protein [Rariglobus sp.]